MFQVHVLSTLDRAGGGCNVPRSPAMITLWNPLILLEPLSLKAGDSGENVRTFQPLRAGSSKLPNRLLMRSLQLPLNDTGPAAAE